ncbi:MAG: ABC transporter ATP-binding protein, partial [bacterium]
MNNQLISIKNLVKYFPIRKGVFRSTVGHVKAVDDVSFDVFSGETLGLVGESGCGKSTTAMTILRLEEPTSGDVFFEGNNLAKI